ncbi:MAG: hypothetical protein M1830_009598 [Pleopsidium flavum]|nr:MAG: hypothetical protein M1830_009598 [Pleopsidium flavum]
MLPTLGTVGDGVIVSRLSRRGKDVRVGDMVNIKHPMWPESGAIKRLVGLPGDFVLRDLPGSSSDEMIQVPEGHCWIIGDNLPWSRDSRTYGPVPLALIKGKVVARVWPLRQMKRIENTLQSVEADEG